MTECSNAEMRDLLPDYLHEQVSAADASLLEQHLATCAECADELALLRAALSVRPRARAVNVAAIVANLPRVHAGAVVTPLSSETRDVRAITSAPSVARRSGGFRNWRAAAAVAVIAVGGFSAVVARRSMVTDSTTAILSDTGVNVGDSNRIASTGSTTDTLSQKIGLSKDVALSVGELSDFSDDELEGVIQRLEKWDGAASADPLPDVPLLPASESNGARPNPGGTQ